MGILSELLHEYASALFPGVGLSSSAVFWPMPSLSTGELSSSAAIEIARVTKQRAELIAQRIIERLAGQVAADWRNDRGYIVCTGAARDVLLSEVFADVGAALQRLGPTDPAATRRVWCLVPDSTAPAYARIRLVARAAMQALLTVVYEGSCLICLHPDQERTVSSPRGVVEVFKGAVLRILDNQGEARIDPRVPNARSASCGPASVWTTHHYHDRFSQQIRKEFADARTKGEVSLLMPADGWLLSRDRALPEILQGGALKKVTARLLSPDAWYVFLFHAAGTVGSGDFDPAVALFEESSSPLWNLRALYERYRRLWSEPALPIDKQALESVVDVIPEPRELLVRPLLIPGYGARAIAVGEIGQWCEAIERLAQRGHAFMNAPETRRALAQDVLNSNSGKIAAGLGFGLSCILPIVVEEACEDQ